MNLVISPTVDVLSNTTIVMLHPRTTSKSSPQFVCFFAATPFSNFRTITEYRTQLLAAGYDRNKIEIRDISDHVFAGMASFIERQDGEVKNIGMTIGRYRAAGKVFKWWARSGIVRGCIVIARR
jgi:hypothetical protein